MTRPSWDHYFLSLAKAAATRSTCPRLQVGACFVRERQVLAMSYNGSSPGHVHCADVGCAIGPSGGCVRTIHAEQNGICQAAKLGISLQGSTCFLTHSPCLVCSRLLVAAGVIRLVYAIEYRLTDHLRDLGIDVIYEETASSP